MDSKLPLMESFPPIAATSKSICAFNAPKSAEKGLPHFSGAEPSFSKYSWKLSQHCCRVPPEANSFATDSTTARYAPA